jgi:hypothetical protein
MAPETAMALNLAAPYHYDEALRQVDVDRALALSVAMQNAAATGEWERVDALESARHELLQGALPETPEALCALKSMLALDAMTKTRLRAARDRATER